LVEDEVIKLSKRGRRMENRRHRRLYRGIKRDMTK
jgi:hypothetical protein